jgi:predicted transcriptional regulator YdeE
MNPTIVTKEAFKGVGVKWSGTFEQAAKREIKELLQNFRIKVSQIKNAINPDTILGLSYHHSVSDFTLYLVVEVENDNNVPDGMESISVPTYTFVGSKYEGEDVHGEYIKLYNWVEQSNYKLDQDVLEHLEEYPIDYNPFTDEPKLNLFIPITEKE